jgi:hypothetical protein
VTDRPKFLFDECLSRPAVRALILPLAQINESADVAHLFDLFPPSVRDSEWIPAIAPQDWVIVTSDRGKRGNVANRLPLLCVQHRVTHVMLSRGMNKRTVSFKISAIQQNWVDLLAAAQSPKGSAFSLYFASENVAKLKQLSAPIIAPDAPPG